MKIFCTVVVPTGDPTDVLIDCSEGLTVGELRDALVRTLRLAGSGGLYCGSSLLSDSTPVAASGICQGVRLSLFAPTNEPYRPVAAGWQLHVISGQTAGSILELRVGEHELGRQPGSPFTDAGVSRRHALLSVEPSGARIQDLGSANGTTVEGKALPANGATVPVGLGEIISLDDTLATIAATNGTDRPIREPIDGFIEYTRPPRLMPSRNPRTIEFPAEPVLRKVRKFPIAAMLAPLVLGIVMAIWQSPIYLLFSLGSPVMAVSNVLTDRRQSGRDNRRARATYASESAAAQSELQLVVAQETARRRDEYPDAAQTVLTALRQGRRLWERRRSDEDALSLRVGTADLPSRVQLVIPRGSAAEVPTGQPRVHAVPAVVALPDVGVLGIAGDKATCQGLARWLLLQLGVYHGPQDLGITVLAPGEEASWAWSRWLPHCHADQDDQALIAIGNDPDTVRRRVTELMATISAKHDALSAGGDSASGGPANRVVVIDGARALRNVPGLTQVLRDGPAVGVFAICIESEERQLPEECAATVLIDEADPHRLTLSRQGQEPIPGILVEQLATSIADVAGRSLSSVRDITPSDGSAPLPDQVRLLELLELEPPTAAAISSGWQAGGRTTRMPLGLTAGAPFTLDLRYDGPHGLIAGTTGSGKSELLQTIVASLAVANRPDAMNFVLVDYKGGSAFKDCEFLPHTVGMVTDLDTHLVQRALTSLGAELKYREHRLAEAGMKDLEDYLDLVARDGRLTPIPRLLIVIDEFASMARELPDFVSGLVNIAQRGRSLGIHLLLATQRPAGIVSPEIRSNTNLRIALRVQDTADSIDVITSPDAARIPKAYPGRGYARLGHSSLVPFQAGRVGGRRRGPSSKASPLAIAVVGWDRLGYPVPSPTGVEVGEDVETTDLSVLVELVRTAAVESGFAEQRRPWLPPLPRVLLLDDLPDKPAPTDRFVFSYGLQDLPASQGQRAATFDLTSDGHMLIVGAPRSGRSQFLRTLAGAIGRGASYSDVHIYGLDCGNGALRPLTSLPHCGAVVGRAQPERVVRLLNRLTGELQRRQALLADLGLADIDEQRNAAPVEERLPHLLLLIDRWEGFTSSLAEVEGGMTTEAVLSILREGASAGVHVVITGDRSLASGRIGSLTDNKIALRLADRGDYTMLALNPRQLPEEIGPGRCFTAESALETQIALLAADASGAGQAAALASIGEQATSRGGRAEPGLRPFRVDELPSRLSFEQAWSYRGSDAHALHCFIGVGGDELTAIGPNFATDAPCFVVAGPPKSGRSTALATMARALLRSGIPVAIAAPRSGPLAALQTEPGTVGMISDPQRSLDHWRELLSNSSTPAVVVIDDGELLRDSPAAELFRSAIRGDRTYIQAIVLGGNSDGLCTGLSGWQVDAKRCRQGALLSPQSLSDGDLIGVRLPRSYLGAAPQLGRAVVHLGDGIIRSVTVPYP
jgi:S-DNA-T family DNA segregation ATPase FtsK/SpoIIIE